MATANGVLTTGYPFATNEVVTADKLAQMVNDAGINPAALLALLSSASTNTLFRIGAAGTQMQLLNQTTGLWHTVWVDGPPGQEVIVIGVGTA